MKTLVGSAVLMAALATGGIPVVMATVAQTDRAVQEVRAEQAVRIRSAAEPRTFPVEDPDEAAEKAATTPDDEADERAEGRVEARGKPEGKGPAKPADKMADGKPGYGPPAHARSVHNRTGTTPGRAGEKGIGLGPVHGKAMRAWADCVSDQAGKDAEDFDPEAVCGTKPTPPGHAKSKLASPKQ
ncbi:MAG TPA: hypothetical protein VFR87_13800 [Nocardioidaceae bacterium]|nr:hypothetical protein [Nocardioidaceae bacterium]